MFGFPTSTTVAAPTPAPTPTPGVGAPVGAPTAAAGATTTTTVPATAAKMDAPASTVVVAAPPDFLTLFQNAFDTNSLSASLATEIKTRFATPYAVQLPPPSTSQTAAPQHQQSTVVVVGSVTGLPMPGGLAGAAAAASQATTAAAQSAAALQTKQLAELLTVLLSCDSGFMNKYDNEVSREKNDGSKETITGLHAAVGAISGNAASSIVTHLKKELSPAALGYDGVGAVLQGVPRGAGGSTRAASGAAVGAHADAGRAVNHIGSNPLMAGAQCLYLLTRHFQMQPSLVKEALELVDLLLTHVQTELSGRRVAHLGSFRDAAETTALCSLAWLVVMSIVNAVAVWKKVRSTTGSAALADNSLIRTDAAATLGNSVSTMRKKFEDIVLASSAKAVGRRDETLGFLSSSSAAGGGGGGGGLLGGGGVGGVKTSALAAVTAAAFVRSGAAAAAQRHRWLSVVESFLSILTLAEGCLLCAKGDERGYDRALEAFVGVKDSPLSEVFGGKVAKRIVQLAPAPTTLAIPIDYIYILPYEMLSYLFDDMLPLIRHVALLEVGSDKTYLDDLQRLEEVGVDGVNANNAMRSNNANGGGDYYYGSWSGHYIHNSKSNGGEGSNKNNDGGTVADVTFTNEMANILHCIAVCLEHLSPDVLDPDLDADCAVTFFIFRNCVKHMGQVFALQRSGSALWENFSLVLVGRFLDVLAMIGRNPQYVERVVQMLTEAQAECPDMQWSSLIAQALECAGFTSSSNNNNNHGGRQQSPLAGATSLSAAAGGGSGNFLYGSGLGASSQTQQQQQQQQRGGGGGEAVPYQFSVEFARRCQQQYISSFFMFLRQVFAHPVLRDTVSQYISLELALSFMFAPWQSQSMLGSTLSLVSALVLTPADAALVWSFLETNKLLQSPQFLLRDSAGNNSSSNSNGSNSTNFRDENLSLLGHCLFESTIGVYSITVGFLNLVISLFCHSVPSTASLSTFASVTHFIAQDIFIGVGKRSFAQKRERYTVVALAAAALRQALAVRFVPEGTTTGLAGTRSAIPTMPAGGSVEEQGTVLAIPFAVVMAPSKSPSDVTGEAVRLIVKASTAPYELASHQRAATRQCVQLLTASIIAARERQLDIFSFDSRAAQSASLAYHTLFLCTANDPLLIRSALRLLLLFPRPVMAQATGYWYSEARQLCSVVALFADLLHPLSVTAQDSIVRAPPELAILDAESHDQSLVFPTAATVSTVSALAVTEDLARENRSLLLDLLVAHALNAELSVTVWLCGFFSASASAAMAGTATADSSLVNQLTDTQILDPVVAGATSAAVERDDAGLAVKYVKLLYLLRSNRLYGSTLMRGFMECACQDLFLSLQRFRADALSPVLLSKYAYVLKLLALEAFDVFNSSPEQLDVTRAVVPSIPAEVLLSLLHPSRQAAGSSRSHHPLPETSGLADSNQTLPRSLSADMTQWLPQCFRRLAAFPTCNPPHSRERYLLPAAQDGILQYNVAALYETFQQEQMDRALPPLSTEDLRTKLGPFVEANQCFLEYASAVNFVDGWCQLLSISCSVVRGIDAGRTRGFFVCLVKAMDATMHMTQAAQEQVAHHLFSTLTTVAAHLKRRCAEEAIFLSGYNAEAAVSQQPQPQLVTNRVNSGHTLAITEGGSTTLATRRRPRDEGGHLSNSGNSNIFATEAGNRSNLVSLAGRTRLARSTLFSGNQNGSHSSNGGLSFSAMMRMNEMDDNAEGGGNNSSDGAANQNLLRRLVVALAQWGGKLPAIRGDAYMSLLCLTQTAGVSADDFVVFRCQDALFDLIAADVSGSDAYGGSSPVARQHALTLLLQLLQTSPALCDAFCSAADGGAGAIGQRPLQCARALLRDVDAAVSTFLAGGETGSAASTSAARTAAAAGGVSEVAPATATATSEVDAFSMSPAARGFGPVLWLLRSAFDYLALLSLQHAPQVLQGNLIASCMVMECWNRCSQVVFGRLSVSQQQRHAQAAAVGVAAGSALRESREVLNRLLLGTVQWFNVMQTAIGDAPQFVAHMQEFVRLRRQLIEYILEAAQPATSWVGATGAVAAALPSFSVSMSAPSTLSVGAGAASAATPGGGSSIGSNGAGAVFQPSLDASGNINTVTLTLLSELTELLRGLSASMLAEECRALVSEMALPELLLSLSSASFAEHCRHHVRGDHLESANAAAMSGGLVGGQATLAARHLDLLALSTRNLTHFLLRSEYGLRAFADDPDAADADAAYPRLRSQPQQVQNLLHITQHVASAFDADSSSSSGTDVSQLRLECHLFALHAMVCLLHSLVLPLPPGRTEAHVKGFLPYLKALPLSALIDLLQICQAAVYKQRNFNADYRTGIAGVRAADGGWTVGAGHSLSNAITDARSESGLRLVQDRDAVQGKQPGTATEPSTSSLTAAKASTPSTPLFNPDGGNWLMGTNQQSKEAQRQQQQHATVAGGDGRRGPALVSTTYGAAEGQHTSTLALNISRVPQTQGQQPQQSQQQRKSGGLFVPATVAGDAAPGETTIGELIERPRHAGALSAGQGEEDALWALQASSASSQPSWEGVLSIESAVRQVKISIANALRAVTSAAELVSRS